MQGKMYKDRKAKGIITVFTATYNRAYILPRLYESLCRQTSREFDWIIVDDGSEDNTYKLVEQWINENKITIHYYKQKNGGKQRAHNYGVAMCQLELFMCVDSDDYIADNCIEKHIERWNEVKNNKKVAGVISLKGDLNGRPLGTDFPENLDCVSRKYLYGKLKFKGDATLVYRTDILRQYPYWVAEGEKFIGEGYVFSQIDQKFDMAVLPEVLTFCEYLSDGYTRNVRRVTKENPKSYMCLKKQTINYSENLYEKYVQTILYLVGCIAAKEKHPIKTAHIQWLAVFAYFPAWLAWVFIYKNA